MNMLKALPPILVCMLPAYALADDGSGLPVLTAISTALASPLIFAYGGTAVEVIGRLWKTDAPFSLFLKAEIWLNKLADMAEKLVPIIRQVGGIFRQLSHVADTLVPQRLKPAKPTETPVPPAQS